MKPITSVSQHSCRARVSAHALIVCGAVALLAGCASEPESHVVSAPPPPAPTATVAVGTAPMVVQPQAVAVPVANAAPGTVVVMQAPPTPQPEAVSARPSSDHLWVPGYWTWRNNRYEWMAGHWEVPPRSGAIWVAPRWESEKGAYRFYEGYWN